MVAKARKPAPLERDVLRSCLAVLRALGVAAERQNTGAVAMRDKHGKSRLVRFGQAGNLDIRGILDGKPLEVEVKRPGNRPTEKQYQRMAFIASQGGIAFWVDDAKTLEAVVRGVRDGMQVKINADGDTVLAKGSGQ